jgi:hypothetical protein
MFIFLCFDLKVVKLAGLVFPKTLKHPGTILYFNWNAIMLKYYKFKLGAAQNCVGYADSPHYF